MALKTLSTFLSPLSLPNTKFPQFLTTKPSLILCEFPRSQKSRLLAADSEGTGAAAPSPGEKFLERQQSFEDAKIILKENKKKRKKKDNAIKASRAVASCYGCGAPLHTSDADAPGYVDPETYELVLCQYRLNFGSIIFAEFRNADCVLACVAEEETPPASNRSV